MAFAPAGNPTQIYENQFGAHTVKLGDGFQSAIYQTLIGPKVLTGVLASLAREGAAGLAAVNTEQCFAVLRVLKGEPNNYRAFPDPLLLMNEDATKFQRELRIRRQGPYSLLLPGEVIDVPDGTVLTVILSAAYAQGDAAGVPSVFLASLNVIGHGGGPRERITSY